MGPPTSSLKLSTSWHGYTLPDEGPSLKHSGLMKTTSSALSDLHRCLNDRDPVSLHISAAPTQFLLTHLFQLQTSPPQVSGEEKFHGIISGCSAETETGGKQICKAPILPDLLPEELIIIWHSWSNMLCFVVAMINLPPHNVSPGISGIK